MCVRWKSSTARSRLHSASFAKSGAATGGTCGAVAASTNGDETGATPSSVGRSIGSDRPVGRENDRALDHVGQLAHVAGPPVAHENRHRVRRNRVHALPLGARVRPDEVRRERGNVMAPLAQRRNAELDDLQSVQQILPEAPLLDHLAEVAVGGGHDPCVNADAPIRADRRNLLRLHGPKQLGLNGRGQLANLIEEESAARRRAKESVAPSVGARERAPLVPEEVALDEGVGDRADVQRDERTVGARGALMDRAGHEPPFPCRSRPR